MSLKVAKDCRSMNQIKVTTIQTHSDGFETYKTKSCKDLNTIYGSKCPHYNCNRIYFLLLKRAKLMENNFARAVKDRRDILSAPREHFGKFLNLHIV